MKRFKHISLILMLAWLASAYTCTNFAIVPLVSEIAICREGQDILERVHDPAKWKKAIFYQDMQMDDTVMAFSTRTDMCRYN